MYTQNLRCLGYQFLAWLLLSFANCHDMNINNIAPTIALVNINRTSGIEWEINDGLINPVMM